MKISSSLNLPSAYVVTGLGYGDEGKGATTDYLVRKHNINLIIRYNGAPHGKHWVHYNKQHFAFSYLGSHIPNTEQQVQTHISDFCNVNLTQLHLECEAYYQAFHRYPIVTVSTGASVILPYYILISQLESVTKGPGYSTGEGSQALWQHMQKDPAAIVRVDDLINLSLLEAKCESAWDFIKPWAKSIIFSNSHNLRASEIYQHINKKVTPTTVANNLFNIGRELVRKHDYDIIQEYAHTHKSIVLEGADGILLNNIDPNYDSCLSTDIKDTFSLIYGEFSPVYMGVLRAYTYWHSTIRQKSNLNMVEKDNGYNNYQGTYGATWLDSELVTNALMKAKIKFDTIFVTCLDKLITILGNKIYITSKTHKAQEFIKSNSIIDYFCEANEASKYVQAIVELLGKQTSKVIFSTGPTATDRLPEISVVKNV